MVTRRVLFGWMVLGGAAAALVGGMVTAVVIAAVESSSIGFSVVYAAISLIVILPLSVLMTAVVFGCTVLVRTPDQEWVLPSVIVSLGGAVVALTVALLLVDWLRWPEAWIPLACAALGAIGGGFVARARASRPRQNSWSSEP
jgi:hypothetical protein